ncbi:hypothetical protein [Flavobacterium suncheonense]|uniref:Tetratricopeptide repeat protein n=1 Tax=Flavobacterium suncheonense GH29-5 = DSM 17707 TaxID=1121899 RepID=A0A0A2MBZ7_9FLAO|nr:hypothetical protein [Flavobacterium suncheonense]KGO88988.1 hypothetical protein Q764_10310 [Flavobacterium suncheonense GH29-5 = DSM 17707]
MKIELLEKNEWEYRRLMSVAEFKMRYLEGDPEIDLLKAIFLKPNSLEAHEAYVEWFLYYKKHTLCYKNDNNENYNRVIQIYTKIIDLDTNYTVLKTGKDKLMYRLGSNYDSEKKQLTLKLKLFALACVQHKLWYKAITNYKEILKIFPENQYAKEQLSLCSLKIQRTDDYKNPLDNYLDLSKN